MPDRAKLSQLSAEMDAWRAEIAAAGATGFPDQASVDAKKQRLKAYYEELQTVPQVLDEATTDPDVLKARASYKNLRASLSDAFQAAQMRDTASADPQATLAAIDAALQARPLPQRPYEPYDKATMDAWRTDTGDILRVSEQSLAQLAQIAAAGTLERNNPGTVQSGQPYDQQDVRRMQTYADSLVRGVNAQYQSVWQEMSDALVGIERDVPTYRPPYAAEMLARDRARTETAKYLAGVLGHDPATAERILDLISTQEANLAASAQASLETTRLPAPASNDKALMKTAATILETPKYGFGKHGPIVLLTKGISEHERKDKQFDVEDADVSLNGDVTFTGTETTWTYKWEEFKFVSPVRDAETGNWHIWTITARKYSSGGNRTPIGKWVSGKAVKGPQILERNF